MQKKPIQSLVWVVSISFLVAIFGYRTTYHWKKFERDVVRENIATQLLLLRHLVAQQSAQAQSALLKNLNENVPSKELLYKTFLKNENGKWNLADNADGQFAFVMKQINFDLLGSGVHWQKVTSLKGQSYFILMVPTVDSEGKWKVAEAESKTYALALFRDPFAMATSLFKTALGSFFVVDEQNYILSHSNSQYQGAKIDHDIAKSVEGKSREVFLEHTNAEHDNSYFALKRIPELNLFVGAEVSQQFSLLKYVRWLFEMIFLTVMLMVGVVVYLRTRKQHLISGNATPIVKTQTSWLRNAIQSKSYHNFKLLAASVSDQLRKNLKNRREELDFIEDSDMVKQTVESLESTAIATVKQAVNLKMLITSLINEYRMQAKLFQIRLSESIDSVPDFNANEAQLRNALDSFMRLALSTVKQQVSKQLSVSLKKSKGAIDLIIQDNGLPRKTDLDELMFDLTQKDEEKLLVPLAYSVVRAHEGSISLSYEALTGNKIQISLPVREMTAAELPTKVFQSPSALRAEEVKKKYRSLQVEKHDIKIRKPKVRDLET